MRSRLIALLAVALVLALSLVLVLARQNGRLLAEYNDLDRRATTPHAGVWVPTFEAVSLDGQPVTVGHTAPAGKQVIFILTTTCPYCRASIPAWTRIAAAASGIPGASAWGISLDSAAASKRYARQYHLPYSVILFPEPKLAHLYRARTVPQTIVVDENGHVIYAHSGVLTGAPVVDSVVAALHWHPRALRAPDSTRLSAGTRGAN